jgi:hypothetical protein
MELAKFVKWVVREGCFEGCDLDGCNLTDEAVKAGILVETTYDRTKHGGSDAAEEGDRWYVFSDEFKAALKLEA